MGIAVGRAWVIPLPAAALPGVAVAAGLGAGVMLASGVDAAPEAALVLLLRFMAAVKAAMVLGVAVAATWRLQTPAASGTAAAYAAACGIMAAGLWPIWAGGPVALAAALVHGGFILAAVAAWRDRARLQAAWRTAGAWPKRRAMRG